MFGRRRHNEVVQAIRKMEGRLMTAIQTFSDKVSKAFSDIATSVDGVAQDVTDLKAKIDELQNSPGSITPEDQALLDQVQQQATTLAEKVKALDDATAQPPTA